MHHPKHRVPHKRPQQPPRRPTPNRDETEHEERVQPEDVDLLEVEPCEGGHGARGREEGAGERGGQVVAAPGLAEGEVGVPG